ncbi:hypothetical protein [Aporhodopirellula aestuarii]|uniref:DUF4399 domain-containing protein n=1 Tax=Aporhodopirellula aestuarii TaxID=2950107 RepID=A0ABT0TXQ5_9BACT|nr:hypothetical protein [Aporhodopirellula aestuarii]MCM2369376.1 hypothetical protein [Aporhodopirellula aestuarii]
MIRSLPACLAFLAFLPVMGLADDPVPTGHSTLHIVFITPHSHQMMGGGMGGMGRSQSPMIRIGDIVGPADDIRPIRISIDGEFVGHAMVGTWDIKPVFVLPEGKHQLTFAIEGLDPVAADIKVLGTNSTQYLIVKLPSKKAKPKNSTDSADASTSQPFDN